MIVAEEDPVMNVETQLHIISVQEFSQLLESRPRRWQKGSPSLRQIHGVPPQLRIKSRQGKQVYDPIVVSLGPYHHGKPELCQAEEFKYFCLDWCAWGSEEKKCFFYNKVLEKIDVIRECYAEVSLVEKYDDKELALMILIDACFIINFIENLPPTKRANTFDWCRCLGLAFPFCIRDIMLLENQLPFQVLKLLISLQYEKEDGEKLLPKFLDWLLILNPEQAITGIPREDEEPPLHILEACWRVVAEKPYTEANQELTNKLASSNFWWPRFLTRRKKRDENVSLLTYHTCHSATDLKAKGIHFKSSHSHSLKDIRFKSHAFQGELQLPVCMVSDRALDFLSNFIAYELSPDSSTDLTVLSYTSFMKSLIESPEDVKELQDKGILFNRFANHEQVVKMFKEIDTFELVNLDIFSNVKQRIGEYCSSRAKTWIADLLHTQFQSPWTTLALLATALLLCLTFLQTYFTIHPAN